MSPRMGWQTVTKISVKLFLDLQNFHKDNQNRTVKCMPVCGFVEAYVRGYVYVSELQCVW